MPELPEVESLRRGLQEVLIGQRIRRVAVKRPKLVSGKGNIRIASKKKAEAFAEGLRGATFERIERRAKNLIFYLGRSRTSFPRRRESSTPANLDSRLRGNDAPVLLVHLKMSGQFIYREHDRNIVVGGHPIESAEKDALPNKHTHVIFELDSAKDASRLTSRGAGGTLYYNDTRMFGYLLYYPSAVAFEAENHFGVLGLEPEDPAFTAQYLRDALKGKKGKIKAILMDQKVVVGLGNIYADESLFMARIRPDRSAATLSPREAKRLHEAIQDVIRRAIGLGGSSVATYRLLDESRGNFAREHQVYGKSGRPCPRCRAPLQKTVIQSRATVFCQQCQQ